MKPYVKLGYRFYDTKSDFSYEKLIGFTSQSSVLSISLGAQTDPLYRDEDAYLTLEGYFNANYLNGDVVKSVQMQSYFKTGGIAYWNIEDKESWAERFFFEVSSINANGLEGYNIGFGFTLNY